MNMLVMIFRDYEVKAILNKFGITNYEQRIKELSRGQQKGLLLQLHY